MKGLLLLGYEYTYNLSVEHLEGLEGSPFLFLFFMTSKKCLRN